MGQSGGRTGPVHRRGHAVQPLRAGAARHGPDPAVLVLFIQRHGRVHTRLRGATEREVVGRMGVATVGRAGLEQQRGIMGWLWETRIQRAACLA